MLVSTPRRIALVSILLCGIFAVFLASVLVTSGFNAQRDCMSTEPHSDSHPSSDLSKMEAWKGDGVETMEVHGPAGSVDEAAVRGKYAEITRALIASNTTITTMESCTSGQVASLITDTEGASAIMRGAFVTYSNEAKVMQGVPAATIQTYGVYSSQTAVAMAQACRAVYDADLGIGVTGSFGNVDPNNADSVPGEVFFALAIGTKTRAYHCTMPAQPSRLHYKLYIADVLADVLQGKLGMGGSL